MKKNAGLLNPHWLAESFVERQRIALLVILMYYFFYDKRIFIELVLAFTL